MKNQARLPRTAGLRTLTEMTTELKKAGFDPSSLQTRAEMLAKIQSAKRKRARDDEDEEMNDMSDDGSEAGDGMDVDGETSPAKRLKTNSGGVVDRRMARTNRLTAGMRDESVRLSLYKCWSTVLKHYSFSAIRQSCQATKHCTASEEHARQSWRGRSQNPDEDGAF